MSSGDAAREQKAMTVRMDRELGQDIAFVASVDGMSINAAIRNAVAAHVAARRADADFQARVSERLAQERALLARLTPPPR